MTGTHVTLTSAQLRVLRICHQSLGAVQGSNLTREGRRTISPAVAVVVADRLVELGYLTRHHWDGRVFQYRITPAGRDLVRAAS